MKITLLRTRLIHPHMKGCKARKHVIDGFWNTAWAIVCVKGTWLKVGRGTSAYLVFPCNTAQGCPAKIAIREDDLAKILPRW
jgi:hypothetical protein